MPTPISRGPSSPFDRPTGPSRSSRGPDWRCPRCGKLLGRRCDGRLHLRFTRSHEYLVGLPVAATCRSCGTLSEIPA
jgi:hypothetical protein